MSLKKTLLLTAIVAALSGSLAAQAAEDKAAPANEGTTAEKTVPDAPKAKGDAPAAASKAVKAKKVKPHDHASFHKSGVETEPAAKPSQVTEAPKAPAHDHQKFHK